ncbi:hypothetical protein M413DRAFT_78620, partial [Hebeloma cylindrosporum]
IYNFHASASAFTQFWNDCASVTSSDIRVTRRLVWQAFVQESIRTIASSKRINLNLREDLNIHEVVTQAFAKLRKTEIIEPGRKHSCSECTQAYKHTTNFMANEDPAAVIGAGDENNTIPALTGEFADISSYQTNMKNQMDVDAADVKMIVLDGVVIAPTHCAFEKCTTDLKNARGGAFCREHEIAYKNKCRMRECPQNRIPNSLACQQHQAE